MKIANIMTRHVDYVDPEMGLKAIARVMKRDDVGCVFVAEHDKLIGVITDRDLVLRGLAHLENIEKLKARDVMSPKVYYCLENDTAHHLSEMMADLQIHRMPVVDDNKRLVGVVSLGDLADRGALEDAALALSGISCPAH